MKETEKQMEFIRFIEECTGVKYNGSTKYDASRYIAENKDDIPPSDLINMWSIIKGY